MKKTGVTILIAFFTAWTITSFAQSEQKVEREVIIIKERIDANGKKTIKKLVKKGFNITDKDIELMMAELDKKAHSNNTNVGKEKTYSNKEIEIQIDSDKEFSGVELEKVLEDFESKDGTLNSSDNIEVTVIKKTKNGETLIEEIIRSSDRGTNEKPRLGIVAKSDDKKQGVLIWEITANSPAESAGLIAGDFITAIDDKSVASISELKEFIQNKKEGDTLNVHYLRNKKAMTCALKLSTMDETIIKKIIRKEIKE